MSKEEAAAQAGGERPGRVRAVGTAPAPSTQPPTRQRHASVQREAQAVQGAQRDGVRWAARPHAQFIEAHEEGQYLERAGEEGSSLGPEDHGRAEGDTQKKYKPTKRPSYIPTARRQKQPPHAAPSTSPTPYQYGRAPEERPATEPPYRYGGLQEERPARGERPPYRHGGVLGRKPTMSAPVEHVPTIKDDDGAGTGPPPPERRPVGRRFGERQEWELNQKRRRRRPMAICFTSCCILFWLLVIAAGVAVLVVYLIYRPHPPVLRVTSATLNAGYIDELGGGRRALNADLTVLAAISNPNKVIHVVLRYMQLDLLFEGSLVGTQAVWPAPLHEGPGGSVLRSVHLVVSEVVVTEEDVAAWRNATAKGGPVMLQLAGQFQTQLNFGTWLPFNYWVHPRCTLWLDPPPGGALRRVRC